MGICMVKNKRTSSSLSMWSKADTVKKTIDSSVMSAEKNIIQPNDTKALILTSRIPIIFLLGEHHFGGINYCNRLAQIGENLVHLNMSLVLTDKKSSANVALEMLVEKIITANSDAEAFIISGYPRNMRDVVEYLNSIERVDLVILLDWTHHQNIDAEFRIGKRNDNINPNLTRLVNKEPIDLMTMAKFFYLKDILYVVETLQSPNEIFKDLVQIVSKIIKRPINFTFEWDDDIYSNSKQTSSIPFDKISYVGGTKSTEQSCEHKVESEIGRKTIQYLRIDSQGQLFVETTIIDSGEMERNQIIRQCTTSSLSELSARSLVNQIQISALKSCGNGSVSNQFDVESETSALSAGIKTGNSIASGVIGNDLNKEDHNTNDNIDDDEDIKTHRDIEYIIALIHVNS